MYFALYDFNCKKMKVAILVCTALFAYVLAAPQYTEEYFKVHQECQEDVHYFIANMTVFQELEFEKKKPEDVELPVNFNDHLYCMYVKLFILTNKGTIDEAVAADKLKTFFPENANTQQIVADCSQATANAVNSTIVASSFYFCLLDYFA
ncbi:uncharacterized protein LOC132704304 [Cylas formicarius]|uniref:uncharacterized protein LOC132704304 n=1 Tax=Cylas formicarius TaxID=197179 RepID=UPI002958D773|nr:uncharacterized protein LOC132704304 [Cylas formicarius]